MDHSFISALFFVVVYYWIYKSKEAAKAKATNEFEYNEAKELHECEDYDGPEYKE